MNKESVPFTGQIWFVFTHAIKQIKLHKS
uniref:Uncharacterized protein n=1 Tax=Anguilla anguilla TaxID=7936 RepID=A0A0E9RUF1_ANGAN